MKKIYKPIARLFIPGRLSGQTALMKAKYKDSDCVVIRRHNDKENGKTISKIIVDEFNDVKKIKLSTMYGVFGKNEN